MKRAATGSVLAVFALALGACGDSEEGSSTAASSAGATGTTDAAGEKRTMALITGVSNEPFYTAMICGAQAAADKNNVDLNVQQPDKFEPAVQIPLVTAAAAKKPDALISVATSSTALYAPLKKVSDSGIPVVVVDALLEKDDFSISQIASDNVAGGAEAAKAMKEQLADGAASQKVITVNNPPGAGSLNLRQKGFEAAAEEQGLDNLGGQYSQDDSAKAASNVAAVLAKNPDLGGIFAPENQNTQGAVNALKRAKKDGKVKIVAFDAQPGVVKQLRAGEVQALVSQSPFDMGRLAVENAIKALDGGTPEKKIDTGLGTLTQSNVDDPQMDKFLYKEC